MQTLDTLVVAAANNLDGRWAEGTGSLKGRHFDREIIVLCALVSELENELMRSGPGAAFGYAPVNADHRDSCQSGYARHEEVAGGILEDRYSLRGGRPKDSHM